MVEERHGSREVFDAILEAMSAVREAIGALPTDPDEQLRETRREAYMRQTIRAAKKKASRTSPSSAARGMLRSWQRCPPPLRRMRTRFKGLPKVKTAATWVPWTYGHLTYASGYGAGINSPGWYHHLWDHSAHDHDGTGSAVTISWMTRVAPCCATKISMLPPHP